MPITMKDGMKKNSIFVKGNLNAPNMKFAIIGNNFQSHKPFDIEQLFKILNKHHAQYSICKDFYDYLVNDERLALPKNIEVFDNANFIADMAISLGGDGTFLKATRYVGRKNIPILGINTGRLGFLAGISPNEMEETFDEIYSNHYKTEERSLLQLWSNNQALLDDANALNDIAVLKHDSSSMITIKIDINGAYLNTYQADGIIIATPTGSTGYSLSVGGPIIMPQNRTISITPVAPHSLNCRPIIIQDTSEVSLEIESRSHNFLVSVDGRSQSCPASTKLRITKADYTIKTINRFDHVFLKTLREKMMWGVDIR